MKGLRIGLSLLMAVFLLCALVYAAGIRFNTTPSIPVGMYRLTHDPIKKGAYVLFCPPPSAEFAMAKARGYLRAGFCPGGFGPMMKKILAIQDDKVMIGKEGVQVNGHLVPLSAPIKADADGRPLPVYAKTWVLGNAEILVMSDSHPESFDGRYFGSIQRSQLKGVIRPILIW